MWSHLWTQIPITAAESTSATTQSATVPDKMLKIWRKHWWRGLILEGHVESYIFCYAYLLQIKFMRSYINCDE